MANATPSHISSKHLGLTGLFIVCLAMLSTTSLGVEIPPTLTILAPNTIQPAGDSLLSHETDLVSNILAYCGYKTEFNYQPFIRHMASFNQAKQIAGVMSVADDYHLDGYTSEPYIQYQYGIVHKQSRHFDIQSIEDLHTLHLATFIHGKKILNLKHHYRTLIEVATHQQYLYMLKHDRVDGVIIDKLTFSAVHQEYRAQAQKSDKKSLEDLIFTPLFRPTPYHMVFRQQPLQQKFDQCLSKLKGNGALSQITEKYTSKYYNIFTDADS